MGNIRGIGVDVVDVERMKNLLDEQGEKFIQKIFTENEITYCFAKQFPHEHYAARFAAKEAVSKAVKTGWSGTFRWKDVEVMNDAAGAPQVYLHNETADLLKGMAVHLSLSHTKNTVVAFVVIEKE